MGGLDPDNRRAFPWDDRAGTRSSSQSVRAALRAAPRGAGAPRRTAWRCIAAEARGLAFERRDGDRRLAVALNAGEEPVRLGLAADRTAVDGAPRGRTRCSPSVDRRRRAPSARRSTVAGRRSSCRRAPGPSSDWASSAALRHARPNERPILYSRGVRPPGGAAEQARGDRSSPRSIEPGSWSPPSTRSDPIADRDVVARRREPRPDRRRPRGRRRAPDLDRALRRPLRLDVADASADVVLGLWSAFRGVEPARDRRGRSRPAARRPPPRRPRLRAGRRLAPPRRATRVRRVEPPARARS